MRRGALFTVGFCAAAALLWIFAADAPAQEKKQKEETPKIDGRVHMVSKDASTITILKDSHQIQIKYDANTKFTYRNKPGTLDDVKEGRRVICLVKKGDGAAMLAARVDVREGK